MANKQIRKTRTEAALNDAFWKLYEKKRISEISVRELTDEAGVHRSSFYSHYTDIYDLLHQSEQKLLDEIADNMNFDETIAAGKSPWVRIMEYFQRNLEKVAVLMGEHGDPGFLFQVRDQIIPQIMQHLKIPEDDLECYYIVDYMVLSVLTFLTNWYRREQYAPPEDLIFRIRDAVMNGCRTPLLQHSSDPEAAARYFEQELQN